MAARERIAVLSLLALLSVGTAIAAGKKTPSSSGSKPVRVRQYSRQDGTKVRVKVAQPPKAPAAAGGVKRDSRGRIKRSPAAKAAFERSNPCPATGKTRGACKGYVIDHRVPLACGGADSPGNMQWQTTAEAKLKDKSERAGCG